MTTKAARTAATGKASTRRGLVAFATAGRFEPFRVEPLGAELFGGELFGTVSVLIRMSGSKSLPHAMGDGRKLRRFADVEQTRARKIAGDHIGDPARPR